jgi:hypothetical protein
VGVILGAFERRAGDGPGVARRIAVWEGATAKAGAASGSKQDSGEAIIVVAACRSSVAGDNANAATVLSIGGSIFSPVEATSPTKDEGGKDLERNASSRKVDSPLLDFVTSGDKFCRVGCGRLSRAASCALGDIINVFDFASAPETNISPFTEKLCEDFSGDARELDACNVAGGNRAKTGICRGNFNPEGRAVFAGEVSADECPSLLNISTTVELFNGVSSAEDALIEAIKSSVTEEAVAVGFAPEGSAPGVTTGEVGSYRKGTDRDARRFTGG